MAGRPTMDAMSRLGLFALVVLLPTITGYAILLAIRGYRRTAESRRRPPPAEPADRLLTRLRRLRLELEATENTPRGPARRHHLRADRGAYLDLLRVACERFGVSPPPGGDRARQADIYRAEAELRERGVDVAPARLRDMPHR
jgi:hypothetical protein